MDNKNPFDQHGKYQFIHSFSKITPLHDNVLVRDMDFEGRKLASGIVLLNDDGKTDGIRPRWAQVYAVGTAQTDVSAGQWVLIEHGRWSRGIKVNVNDEEFVMRRVDPACIMFVSDDKPEDDETISSAVYAERKER